MRRSRVNSRPDELLLAAYLVTLVIGLVMVYSSSSILAESRFGSQWFFLGQQLVWSLIALVCVYFIAKCDLKRLAVYSAPALIATMIALSLVFLMPSRNEAHRWLMFGPFTVQPSEFFKFVLVFYLAFSLSNAKRNLSNVQQLAFPYVPLIGAGLVLILLEPDLGTTVVVSVVALGVFFLAGVRVKHLAAAIFPVLAGAATMVFVFGYKQERISSYLSSIIDPLQRGYQVKQAALTLGSGGLFGVGLGEGRQKLFFLPYPHTDFIFASMGEELGMIGLLVLLGFWGSCE